MKKAMVLVALLLSIQGDSLLLSEGPGPGFIFEFASASPEEFSDIAGKNFGPFEVLAGIRPLRLSGTEGPQGWSIAVSHDPGAPTLELLQVTIDGTNAGELFDRQSGFLQNEIIDPDQNGGKRGFVTAATLSIDRQIFLPPDRLSTVISATYRGIHPTVTSYTETELTFLFSDGLAGSAGPVVNNVSYGDGSYFPDFLPLKRMLKTTPACNPSLTLELNAPGSAPEGEVSKVRIDLPAGQDLVLETTVKLNSGLSGQDGAEAWSISIQHDPSSFEILEATTAGTDTELLADPENRIIKTQIIRGDEGSGFFSAVVLSTATLLTLPPVGDFSIARARYRLVAPHDVPGLILPAPIRFQDGLKDVSYPVPNIFTVGGKSVNACLKRAIQVEVNVVKGGKVFRRGDANNDARINITDALWLLRWNFYGSPLPVCQAALDANGDLSIDPTDVVSLLNYLFKWGDPLPLPSLRCAPEPHLDDPLPCDEASVNCP